MDAGSVFVGRFNLLVQACLLIDIPLRLYIDAAPSLEMGAQSCILRFLDLILALTVDLELTAAD